VCDIGRKEMNLGLGSEGEKLSTTKEELEEGVKCGKHRDKNTDGQTRRLCPNM
jgi:hypothetical protein